MRRSSDEAEGDLGHLFDLFYDGMMAGIGAYYGPKTHYAATAHLHRKTTKRSIVFDHATHELSMLFEKIDGIAVKRGGETARFFAHGKWIISVHKADRSLRISLNKTKQSSLFQTNEIDLQPPLDFSLAEDRKLFPEMTSLFLVYVPDEDVAAPEIYLLCPDDSGFYWATQLRKGGDGAIVHLTPPPDGDDNLVKIPDAEEKGEID
jgi:hypothetical protein